VLQRTLYKSLTSPLASCPAAEDCGSQQRCRGLSGLSRQVDVFGSAIVDEQLKELKAESDKVVGDLRVAPNKALCRVSSDKEITSLSRRLDSFRNQIDTAVLVSIQYVFKPRDGFACTHIGKDLTTREYNLDRNDDEEKVGIWAREAATRRYDETLSAIRCHECQSSRPHDVEAFSANMSSASAAELEDRLAQDFKRMIISRLYFRHKTRPASWPSANSTLYLLLAGSCTEL
jgi:hypothetical protein